MQFSWYGFILGVAVVTVISLSEFILRRTVPQHEVAIHHHWWKVATLILVGALIGGRLYHLSTDWPLYVDQPLWKWFATWNGGMGILGALAGGFLGLLAAHRWLKLPFSWRVSLGALAISVPFGQALGRWGNFVNQELFGLPTILAWGIYIEPAFRPDQFALFSHFHPLFLYESIAMFIAGSMLLWLWWYTRSIRDEVPFFALGSGLYLGLYALAYGSIRFMLDFLRWDLRPGLFDLTYSQWGSLFLILVGLLQLTKMTKPHQLTHRHRSSAKKVPSSRKQSRSRGKQTMLGLAVFGITMALVARPVHAQLGAPQPAFDLSIDPAVVEIAMQPGRIVTQAIELTNNGTTDLQVTVQLRDFVADNTSGQPVLLENSSFPYARLQNADISLNEPFSIAAGQSQQLVLALDLPDTAETKDWYFTLLAESQPITSDLIVSGTQARGTIGANFLVRVSPDNLEPLSWDVDLPDLPLLMDSLQNLTIRPLVFNRSQTYAAPELSLVVLDWQDNIVYEREALPERILAQSRRYVRAGEPLRSDPRSFEPVDFVFDPLFAIGPYTIRASISNNMSGPVVVEHTVWALPISLFLLLATLGIALAGVYWWRRQR